MASKRGRRGGGPLRGAITGFILGAVFLAMGSYALNEVLGAWWPPEVLALWGAADDFEDRFAIVLLSLFQWLGALMLVTAPLGVVGAMRRKGAGESDAEGDRPEAPPPWLRRPDWASGKAEAVGDGRGRPRFVLLTLLNLILWPGGIWLTGVILADDTTWNGMLVLVLSFPVLVGMLLLGQVRRLVRRVRFGTTLFHMDTLPGEVGGYLAGRLKTRIRPGPAPPDGFEVHLTAYRRMVSRSGDGSRSVSHAILYRDEQWVRGEPDPETGLLELPLVFDIPDDAPSTDPGRGIRWFLEVRARIPGPNYQTVLSVPVYRTEEARPRAEASTGAPSTATRVEAAVEGDTRASGGIPETPTFLAYRENRMDPPVSSPTAGVKVEIGARGEIQELRVSARAGLGFGVTLLIGGLMFLGAVPVARVADDAPLWVIPVSLAAGVILVFMGLRTLTTSTVLRFDPGAIQLRSGPFGLGATNMIPYPRLERADVRATGGQVGSRAVYALYLVLRDGEQIQVTDLLRSRAEADRLARLAQDRIDARGGVSPEGNKNARWPASR